MADHDSRITRMKELVQILRSASRAYYQESSEIMSNFEYDRLYDELETLEKETGVVLSGSPTVSVGYEALDSLPRERHAAPMLSLEKTKDIEVLRAFAGEHKTLLSWKLDGLTVVLTYRGGELVKAVTRGNGEIGEVITGNARVFVNLPLHISFKGELVLRGEAVISYPDFERINEGIPETDAKYKNPRNLCSGSVRQLNNEITAQRSVQFYAFTLVSAESALSSEESPDFRNSREEQLIWLKKQGFTTVEYKTVTAKNLDEAVAYFSEKIKTYDIPSDGLVALYDDIAYGNSLGRTAKSPRNSLAFKWKDELQETVLREIEWSASRTGLINPVAVFDPVELEGTTVSRASVHNVSIVRGLQLGIGDRITVYKANMIIPQIADNLTRSGRLEIPERCPVCGGKTAIRTAQDVQTLVCENPECMAKRIKALELFVSRNALNIDGLSEATLEKFVAAGFIHSFTDLFHLDEHREKIIGMEGFGEKSFENLISSIDSARKTTLPRLLYALGIPGIGAATARLIVSDFGSSLDEIRKAGAERLEQIEGIGPVLAKSFSDFFAEEANVRLLDALLHELTIPEADQAAPVPGVGGSRPGSGEGAAERAGLFAGKVFVVTGAVHHFANRDELKEHIEQLGGKVTGSVSSKTDYLINNDAASGSSKNRKARELGIPVITEEQFLEMENGS